MIKALAAYKRLTAEFTRLLSQAKLLYSFLFRSTSLQLKDTEILKDIETLITPTNQDLYKRLTKIYIKFQQIRVKIKIHTSIIDLEFSMSFANLFIGLVMVSCIFKQRSPTSYNMSSFWPLEIALQKFSIDNFSKPFQFL